MEWWIWLVLAGIVFSGYQAWISRNEERAIEAEAIEAEGTVYMERIEHEKEKRRGQLEG